MSDEHQEPPLGWPEGGPRAHDIADNYNSAFAPCDVEFVIDEDNPLRVMMVDVYNQTASTVAVCARNRIRT